MDALPPHNIMDAPGAEAAVLRATGCEPAALERAAAVAAEAGLTVPDALVQLGLVSERALAEIYARVLALPIAAAARYPAEPILPEILRPRFLRAARAVPAALHDGGITVITAAPLDEFTPAAIALATGRAVTLEIGVPVELEAAFDRLYPVGEAPAAAPSEAETGDDAERLKDIASEAPVIRLVNQIIGRAVETGASDIHVEPFEDRLRIRYRYDGELVEAESQPARLSPAIISRLKILARLDIAERRLPQDGRIRLAVRGQDVVFRVATAPCLHGENVVLRVLDRSAVAFDFAEQGLQDETIARLRAALAAPNGILLVTGPTGSGKTTTLYTALRGLNETARKIITVEDPIEFQLAGINQIQVRPNIDLGFATLLRSIVRLDPDVIMVGEIRDLETAEIAARAALTGHLVLSTLHTNSAAAAVTRLRDMGVQDYLVAAVLRGVLAQRLVRRLCPACKQPATPAPELVRRFPVLQSGTLFSAAGCPACRHTGFRGRTAIAEFLTPDAEIERLLFARAGQAEIEAAAIRAGMRTMLETGLAAAARGETTPAEIFRVIRPDM
jgi:general secretion pathway protein E